MNEVGTGVVPSRLVDPLADAEQQPFWTAALRGILSAPRCRHDGTVILPAAPRCFVCRGADFEWIELPGTGTIYSFTVVRHPLAPHLGAVVPYVSAVVDLDGTQGAGARMLLNVIDVEPERVAIGDRVRGVFDRVSDVMAVPRAVPA